VLYDFFIRRFNSQSSNTKAWKWDRWNMVVV